MEFYVVYLSILVYCYAQIFRKEQNLDTLKEVNPRNLILFIAYNLLAVIASHYFTNGNQFGISPNFPYLGILYFGLMFLTCLLWRRKNENFLNPFILNNRWNFIGALGTLQYAIIVSFLHSILEK